MFGFTTIALIMTLLGLLPFGAAFPEPSRLVTCQATLDAATTEEEKLQVACGYAGQESDVTYFDVLRIPDDTSPESDYKYLLSCAVNGGVLPKCQSIDVKGYRQTEDRGKCNVTAFVRSSEHGLFGCQYITSAGKLITFCKLEATTAEPTTSATTTTEQSLEQDKIPNETHDESCQSKWNSTTTIVLIVSTIVSLSLGALVGYVLANTKTKLKKIVTSVLAGINPVKPTVDSGSTEPLKPTTDEAPLRI